MYSCVALEKDIGHLDQVMGVPACLHSSNAVRSLWSEIGATKFRTWVPTTWSEEPNPEMLEVYAAILKTFSKKDLKLSLGREDSFVAKIHSLVKAKNDVAKIHSLVKAESTGGESKKMAKELKRKASAASQEQGEEPEGKAAKPAASSGGVWTKGEHAGEKAMCRTTKAKEGWNDQIVTIKKVLAGKAEIQNAAGEVRTISLPCLHRLSPEEEAAAEASGENPPAGTSAVPVPQDSEQAALAQAAERAKNLLGSHLTSEQQAAFAGEDDSSDDDDDDDDENKRPTEETLAEANAAEALVVTDCDTETAFGSVAEWNGESPVVGDAAGVAATPQVEEEAPERQAQADPAEEAQLVSSEPPPAQATPPPAKSAAPASPQAIPKQAEAPASPPPAKSPAPASPLPAPATPKQAAPAAGDAGDDRSDSEHGPPDGLFSGPSQKWSSPPESPVDLTSPPPAKAAAPAPPPPAKATPKQAALVQADPAAAPAAAPAAPPAAAAKKQTKKAKAASNPSRVLANSLLAKVQGLAKMQGRLGATAAGPPPPKADGGDGSIFSFPPGVPTPGLFPKEAEAAKAKVPKVVAKVVATPVTPPPPKVKAAQGQGVPLSDDTPLATLAEGVFPKFPWAKGN